MILRFLGQAVLQVAGLFYAAIMYNKKEIDDADSYIAEVDYALPSAILCRGA